MSPTLKRNNTPIILYNLGCKLNQYDGKCLFEKFSLEKNLVIVNTCCVTEEARIKSLKKLRSAIRSHPGYKVIATGCAVQFKRNDFLAADEVIELKERNEIIKGVFPKFERSRYFLKIEDGCNEPCTFCVVSRLRPKIESKPLDVIKKEIGWARSLGFNEIVLVGANIGLYGRDCGLTLKELLRALGDIADLPRIRLSSIEPKFINQELVKALKNLPFCRHIHIPFQSGDDKILSLMGRDYTLRHLQDIMEILTREFSNIAIGGDCIVGFPNEGEREFNNTFNFVKSNPFTHLHIFPYSPRPNTEAYTLDDSISKREKKKRLHLLSGLIKEKNYRFRKEMLGKIFEVIVEKKDGNETGLTDNYIRVKLDKPCKEKELKRVEITGVFEDSTVGKVI